MYYIFQVLELTGYNISQGADFKLFAVMAALYKHKDTILGLFLCMLIVSGKKF
jgi:hypothetical protein